MPAEITPQYGRDTDSNLGDIQFLASEWLEQLSPGVLHAIDRHYGVAPALREIATTGASLVSEKVLPYELRPSKSGGIKVNRYQYRFRLPGILPIKVPSSVYFVDEIYRLYRTTGGIYPMLNALDWVNDSLGFPGVLTTMSAAGLPFPSEGARSRQTLETFKGEGFSVYSDPSEWKRLSNYPNDQGAGMLGSIFDKQSPERWRRFYEQMCIAYNVVPNLGNDYWLSLSEVIYAKEPTVTMVLASVGENRVFRGEIGLRHYGEGSNLRNGDNGKVSGNLLTMWVTPYNVDICPPPTWNAGIPKALHKLIKVLLKPGV